MLRTSNQGQDGPFSRLGGLGLQLNALCGFVHFTGWEDRDPLSFMFAYPDYFVPHFAVAAVSAALDNRRRTGEGRMIDLAQNEAAFHFIAPQILEYGANGRESTRHGNSDPHAAPHNAYPCKGDDSWCAIAVFTDDEWQRFCGVLGNPAWTTEPRFTDLSARQKNEVELNRLVGEWTSQHTAQEVMERMQAAGVASGVVKKSQDVREDPQLNENDFFWMMDHPEIGEFPHMGQPSTLSETPARPRMPAPRLGEHTEFVCKEFLGMSDAEFDRLLVAGAFAL
jgi:benzylsuccinate CoA-transferase BbsF subunit